MAIGLRRGLSPRRDDAGERRGPARAADGDGAGRHHRVRLRRRQPVRSDRSAGRRPAGRARHRSRDRAAVRPNVIAEELDDRGVALARHDHPPPADRLVHLPVRGLSPTCWQSCSTSRAGPTFPRARSSSRGRRPSPPCGRTTTIRPCARWMPLPALHLRRGSSLRAGRPRARSRRSSGCAARTCWRSTPRGSGRPLWRWRSSATSTPALALDARRGGARGLDRADGRARAGAGASGGRRVAGASRESTMPGKAQADIAYGFNTISRLDPRYYAYWMMNNVLGQFGLGGRLADNIRERQGMAYYAYSTLRRRASAKARCSSAPASIRRTSSARSRRSTRGATAGG